MSMSYDSDMKLNLDAICCLWQEDWVDKKNYGGFFNNETEARLSKPYQLPSHSLICKYQRILRKLSTETISRIHFIFLCPVLLSARKTKRKKLRKAVSKLGKRACHISNIKLEIFSFGDFVLFYRSCCDPVKIASLKTSFNAFVAWNEKVKTISIIEW